MKTIFLLLTALPLFFNPKSTKAQGRTQNKETVIRSFISALFKEKKEPKLIIKDYMNISPCDTVPFYKREEAIINLMDSLKKKVGSLLATKDYKVVGYSDFTGTKKTFSGSTKDIFIVSINKSPIIYFYLEQDKILSFTLIEKGEYGYFILI